MSTYLWCFFILGFIGWVGEVAFAAIIQRRFVNRGFLSGPLCPIYGIGAVAMYLTLRSINHTMLLFLGALLIGSAVEWIAGFLLEKIFHQKWWDYSDRPYHLNGYICLSFSILWGIAGVVVVRWMMPPLIALIGMIPQTLGMILLILFSALTIADFVTAIVAAAGIRKELHNLETISTGIKQRSDRIGKAVSDSVLTAAEKIDKLGLPAKYEDFSEKTKLELHQLKEKYGQSLQRFQKNRFQMRLLRAFPHSTSQKYNEHLQKLREAMEGASKRSSAFSQRRNEIALVAYEPPVEAGQPLPFAHGVSFAKLFWVFMAGNFIGFLVETFWCLINPPYEFQLRVSLIYGPFVLVYGIGAVAFTVLLHRFYNRKSSDIFLVGVLIGAAVEYLASLFQETVFGSVSWDYTGSVLNLGGRTNLMYSFFWGILGMIWIKDLYPRLSLFIEKMPKKAGNLITAITVLYIALDMILSSAAVYRQSQRLQDVPATNSVQVFLDQHYDDEFLAKRYVNMQFRVEDEAETEADASSASEE